MTERCGGAALADAQGQPTREFSLFLARYTWESVRDRTLDRDFETMVESAVFAARDIQRQAARRAAGAAPGADPIA